MQFHQCKFQLKWCPQFPQLHNWMISDFGKRIQQHKLRFLTLQIYGTRIFLYSKHYSYCHILIQMLGILIKRTCTFPMWSQSQQAIQNKVHRGSNSFHLPPATSTPCQISRKENEQQRFKIQKHWLVYRKGGGWIKAESRDPLPVIEHHDEPAGLTRTEAAPSPRWRVAQIGTRRLMLVILPNGSKLPWS